MDNNISDLSIIILVTFHGVIHEVITAFNENRGVWVHYMSALSMLLWAERERNGLFNYALNTLIYGYIASYIWLRTILIVRKETCCHHIGYSYRLTARVLLYAPSHRQDNTYHSLCYTSRGALAGTRNRSMGPWRIDPMTHHTMSERSTSELRPAPALMSNAL